MRARVRSLRTGTPAPAARCRRASRSRQSGTCRSNVSRAESVTRFDARVTRTQCSSASVLAATAVARCRPSSTRTSHWTGPLSAYSTLSPSSTRGGSASTIAKPSTTATSAMNGTRPRTSSSSGRSSGSCRPSASPTTVVTIRDDACAAEDPTSSPGLATVFEHPDRRRRRRTPPPGSRDPVNDAMSRLRVEPRETQRRARHVDERDDPTELCRVATTPR